MKFHFRPGEEKRREESPFSPSNVFPRKEEGRRGERKITLSFFLLLQKITSSFLFPLEFRATGEITRFFFLLSLPPSFAASRSIIYLGWILLPSNPRFPIQPPFLLRKGEEEEGEGDITLPLSTTQPSPPLTPTFPLPHRSLSEKKSPECSSHKPCLLGCVPTWWIFLLPLAWQLGGRGGKSKREGMLPLNYNDTATKQEKEEEEENVAGTSNLRLWRQHQIVAPLRRRGNKTAPSPHTHFLSPKIRRRRRRRAPLSQILLQDVIHLSFSSAPF